MPFAGIISIPRCLRFCRAMTRYSVLWRNQAIVRTVWPVIPVRDVTLVCFRRASCSTSVGLDATVMA